jgi:hypothetical protein
METSTGITYRGLDITATVSPTDAGGFQSAYRIEGEDSAHTDVATEQSNATFDTEDDAITAAFADARAYVDAMLEAR